MRRFSKKKMMNVIPGNKRAVKMIVKLFAKRRKSRPRSRELRQKRYMTLDIFSCNLSRVRRIQLQRLHLGVESCN